MNNEVVKFSLLSRIPVSVIMFLCVTGMGLVGYLTGYFDTDPNMWILILLIVTAWIIFGVTMVHNLYLYLYKRETFTIECGVDFFEVLYFERFLFVEKKRFFFKDIKDINFVLGPHNGFIYINLKNGKYFSISLIACFILSKNRKKFVESIKMGARKWGLVSETISCDLPPII